MSRFKQYLSLISNNSLRKDKKSQIEPTLNDGKSDGILKESNTPLNSQSCNDRHSGNTPLNSQSCNDMAITDTQMSSNLPPSHYNLNDKSNVLYNGETTWNCDGGRGVDDKNDNRNNNNDKMININTNHQYDYNNQIHQDGNIDSMGDRNWMCDLENDGKNIENDYKTIKNDDTVLENNEKLESDIEDKDENHKFNLFDENIDNNIDDIDNKDNIIKININKDYERAGDYEFGDNIAKAQNLGTNVDYCMEPTTNEGCTRSNCDRNNDNSIMDGTNDNIYNDTNSSTDKIHNNDKNNVANNNKCGNNNNEDNQITKSHNECKNDQIKIYIENEEDNQDSMISCDHNKNIDNSNASNHIVKQNTDINKNRQNINESEINNFDNVNGSPNITNQNNLNFNLSQLYLLPSPGKSFLIGDGYIHLNTCLSGKVDKPPLPERNVELVLKGRGGLGLGVLETCHNSLPRRRHHVEELPNFASLKGTSEGILNTGLIPSAPPESSRVPPPLPARKLIRSKIHSMTDDVKNEALRQERLVSVRSSSSEHRCIDEEDIVCFINANNNTVKNKINNNSNYNMNNTAFNNTGNNAILPQIRRRLKQADRSSFISNRDSEGYLTCDQGFWEQIPNQTNCNKSLQNKVYSGRKEKIKKSIFKDKTNSFNKTIDIADNCYNRYHNNAEEDFNIRVPVDNYKGKERGHENLRSLLNTTVPLPKKNINRFHSHSNTRSNVKEIMTPLPRCSTYDDSRSDVNFSIPINPELFSSKYGGANRRQKDSRNSEVSYLQLDMDSPGSSPRSNALNQHKPPKSNYKQIDWDRTKALIDLRSNRSDKKSNF